MFASPLGSDRKRRCPGQLEEPLGATSAVVRGFQLVGAAGTAGRATFDATETFESEANPGPATATIAHMCLPFCTRDGCKKRSALGTRSEEHTSELQSLRH